LGWFNVSDISWILQLAKEFIFASVRSANCNHSFHPARLHGTTRKHVNEYSDVWYWRILRETVSPFRFWLKSDSQNWCCTWIYACVRAFPAYTYIRHSHRLMAFKLHRWRSFCLVLLTCCSFKIRCEGSVITVISWTVSCYLRSVESLFYLATVDCYFLSACLLC
jgi:hypothetical protein